MTQRRCRERRKASFFPREHGSEALQWNPTRGMTPHLVTVKSVSAHRCPWVGAFGGGSDPYAVSVLRFLTCAFRMHHAGRSRPIPVRPWSRFPRSGGHWFEVECARLRDSSWLPLEVLYEVASGRVVNLGSPRQERPRLPTRGNAHLKRGGRTRAAGTARRHRHLVALNPRRAALGRCPRRRRRRRRRGGRLPTPAKIPPAAAAAVRAAAP